MARTLNFGMTFKKWDMSVKSSDWALLCYILLQEDVKGPFIDLGILFTVRAGGHTQILLKIHLRISVIQSYEWPWKQTILQIYKVPVKIIKHRKCFAKIEVNLLNLHVCTMCCVRNFSNLSENK